MVLTKCGCLLHRLWHDDISTHFFLISMFDVRHFTFVCTHRHISRSSMDDSKPAPTQECYKVCLGLIYIIYWYLTLLSRFSISSTLYRHHRRVHRRVAVYVCVWPGKISKWYSYVANANAFTNHNNAIGSNHNPHACTTISTHAPRTFYR